MKEDWFDEVDKQIIIDDLTEKYLEYKGYKDKDIRKENFIKVAKKINSGFTITKEDAIILMDFGSLFGDPALSMEEVKKCYNCHNFCSFGRGSNEGVCEVNYDFKGTGGNLHVKSTDPGCEDFKSKNIEIL